MLLLADEVEKRISPVTTRIVVPTVLKALLMTQEKAILVVPSGALDRLTSVPVCVIGGGVSVIRPGPGPLSFRHKVVTPGPIVLITEKKERTNIGKLKLNHVVHSI